MKTHFNDELVDRLEYKKRPMLTDPEEFAIIRSIYLQRDIREDREDQQERRKVNRNQSR